MNRLDYLDADAIPLDLDQLKLLMPGDRVVVEKHLPDGFKIYTRGAVRSGFEVNPYPAPSLCINNERTSDEKPYGHSCTTLYSTFIDSSGKYKNRSDERSIYRDPDLETLREYSYPVETSMAGKSIVVLTPGTGLGFDNFPESMQYIMEQQPLILLDSPDKTDLNSDRIAQFEYFFSNDSNTNCVYNARSSHLKCTVHPSGSCDGCKDSSMVISMNKYTAAVGFDSAQPTKPLK
jgi:Family of unknown function (DUF6464)